MEGDDNNEGEGLPLVATPASEIATGNAGDANMSIDNVNNGSNDNVHNVANNNVHVHLGQMTSDNGAGETAEADGGAGGAGI